MTARESFLAEVEISRRAVSLGLAGALLALPVEARAAQAIGGFHDVRDHGARGDGATVDSPAINRAIEAAAREGGGTVVFPPGRYLSFSIRLRDNITLLLAAGAVIEAADPDHHPGAYDLPEVEAEFQYQDFGITHVHNSLIWGDGVSNVAIVGHGLLHGVGLDRAGPGDRWPGRKGWQSATQLGLSLRDARLRDPEERHMEGRGNKTIGLRNCRNVVLRDFTILQGGHFGLIAHGVTNMTIDGLTVDTDRDGLDIDCCRDVRISNCIVNAPKDDAIVIKSSYALGRPVVCENITVIGCKTSGYMMGSLLDGTYRKTDYRLGPLGRIKLGTESNGGFRNIQITGCTCESSRGILIGVVDGGTLEDVSVSDIVLRDPLNHPLFVHQAARLRAPAGTPVGACRRVEFSNVHVSGANPMMPCGVAGIADAPVEDISFTNIHVSHRGGGTEADAKRIPPDRRETSLEVSFMGPLPALGFFGRHARRLTVRDLQISTETPDARPCVVLEDVQGAIVDGLAWPASSAHPVKKRDSHHVAVGRVRRL